MPDQRTLLSPAALAEGLATLPGWEVEGSALAKGFGFPDYAHAVLFAVAVAHAAERLDHHPDMWITWGKVKVKTWTHTCGGVSRLDLELAGAVEELGG